ncbi:hypothetical protein FJ365_05030 [Candidatus Dependentiae bacterium]|nr:hypothetical protein [Candidatus Dependentiae bacterium]
MLSETVSSLVLFRWAIFCLLCYKCYQLAHQYVLPWLYDAMQQEQNTLTELVNKDKLAMVAKQKIENQLHDQHQLFIVLEQNIQRWHTAIINETNSAQQAALQRVNILRAKQAKQQRHLFLAQSMIAIIPEAIEKAEAALVQQHNYSNYFDGIISNLSTTKTPGQTL